MIMIGILNVIIYLSALYLSYFIDTITKLVFKLAIALVLSCQFISRSYFFLLRVHCYADCCMSSGSNANHTAENDLRIDGREASDKALSRRCSYELSLITIRFARYIAI